LPLAPLPPAPHSARSLTPGPAGRLALARSPKGSKKDPDEGHPDYLAKCFITVLPVEERRDVILLSEGPVKVTEHQIKVGGTWLKVVP